jgi:hypothetical protein
MSATGKADHEHRLIDAREINGPYRAAQNHLEAPSSSSRRCGPARKMHIAAESDHDVTGPFCWPPEPSAERCPQASILSQGQITTLVMPLRGC